MSTYTVKKGDTLSGIAQSQLGSADRWPELQRLNDIPDADLIYPGQTIRLPYKTSDSLISKILNIFKS